MCNHLFGSFVTPYCCYGSMVELLTLYSAFARCMSLRVGKFPPFTARLFKFSDLKWHYLPLFFNDFVLCFTYFFAHPLHSAKGCAVVRRQHKWQADWRANLCPRSGGCDGVENCRTADEQVKLLTSSELVHTAQCIAVFVYNVVGSAK